jgi:poly-gamma-glutamate synthesis protein (capsule biosynthesis protein)
MLDRYVAKHIQTEGFDSYFNETPRAWLGTDITLANLEGCFTDFEPRALDPNNLAFTFDPNLIPTLQKYNFTTFSLANNHSLNFGAEGLAQCIEYLLNGGFDYYGHPKNMDDLSVTVTVRNVTIGFVGYNALEKTPLSDITDEISRIRPTVDYVIATPHWGNEYHDTPSATQKQAAHAMIDAGADLILGTHPHVIQPIEEYKGKMIFYSLGNFIFDQMFSEETRTGLTVGINLTSTGASFWLFPISNADFSIDFLEGEKRDTLLKELATKSEVSDGLKSEIEDGYIN